VQPKKLQHIQKEEVLCKLGSSFAKVTPPSTLFSTMPFNVDQDDASIRPEETRATLHQAQDELRMLEVLTL
jgi:hypothetical protein